MSRDGEQLLAAAKEDLDQVKQLVEGGADVRAIDEVRALLTSTKLYAPLC